MSLLEIDEPAQINEDIFSFRYKHQASSGGKLYILSLAISEIKISAESVKTDKIPSKKLLDEINFHHSNAKRPNLNLARSLGLIKVSEILKQSKKAKYAINGGFYLDFGSFEEKIFHPNFPQAFYGDPVGWLRTNGVDISLPWLNRPILKILPTGNIKIEYGNLIDKCLIIKSNIFHIEDINILKKSTYITDLSSLKKYKIHYLEKYIFAQIINNRVGEIQRGVVDSMPENGFILAIREEQIKSALKMNDKVLLLEQDNSSYCITMAPTLLKNKKISNNKIWGVEDFTNENHPRTLTKSMYAYRAARTGIFFDNSKQRIFFAVSENNKSKLGEGLTLYEFTKLVCNSAKKLGFSLESGFYIDGGSSSIMCMKDKKKVITINKPSGISNPNVYGAKRNEEVRTGIVILIEKNEKD
ncbi:MAG: phosphodiester glycosidase family protein [Candidatus Roizmanbacteria bacterium]